MSFVKDVIKVTVGYTAIYTGVIIGMAAGLGAAEPVMEFVGDKTKKFLGKFKDNEEEEFEE